MNNNPYYLLITLVIISGIFIQCDISKKNESLSKSTNHEIFIENASSISLITIIPNGAKASFIMGSSDAELKVQPSMDHPDYSTDDEQPTHIVTLTVPFELSQFEITNAQYCQVMNYAIRRNKAKIIKGDLKGSDGKMYLGITHLDTSAKYLGIQYGIRVDGDSIKTIQDCGLQPVHGVTWFGAVAFCNFLSEIKGLSPVYNLTTSSWDTTKNGFRLPTEAEWEYAARKDKRYSYAWGNEIDNRFLNYYPSQTAEYDKQTGKFNRSVFKPVGFYNGAIKEGVETQNNASPFGIYDMNGNVWEWCWDWYGRDYYKYSPVIDPKGPEKGDDRPPYDLNKPTKVWRGCGWAGNDAFSRIAKRWSTSPETAINEVGFRIARSLY